jgi:hypothetical protein
MMVVDGDSDAVFPAQDLGDEPVDPVTGGPRQRGVATTSRSSPPGIEAQRW